MMYLSSLEKIFFFVVFTAVALSTVAFSQTAIHEVNIIAIRKTEVLKLREILTKKFQYESLVKDTSCEGFSDFVDISKDGIEDDEVFVKSSRLQRDQQLIIELHKILQTEAHHHCQLLPCGDKLCRSAINWNITPELVGKDLFTRPYEPTRYYFTKLICTSNNYSEASASDACEFKDDDFETIESSLAEESDALKIPDKTTVTVGDQFKKSLPVVAMSAVFAAVHAVRKKVFDADLADPETYSISSYLRTGVAAAFAAATTDAVRVASGPEPGEIDVEELLTLVQTRIDLGEKYFAREQVNTVHEWLGEARRMAAMFCAKGNEDMAKVVSSTVSEDRAEPGAGAPKLERRKKTTLSSLMEQTTKAAKYKRPNLAQLEKENPKYFNLLSGLIGFLKFPYEKAQVTQDEMLHSMAEFPALGSDALLAGIAGQAGVMVENLISAKEKRILYSASGPGTGKTTGLKLMGKWSKHPVCTITGSEFQAKPLDHGQTPWDQLVHMITDCIRYQFTIERVALDDSQKPIKKKIRRQKMSMGKRIFEEDEITPVMEVVEEFVMVTVPVTNGIILFDDFQYALQGPDGKFFGEKNKRSRDNFFRLLKDLGDVNISCPLAVSLAADMVYPVSTQNIYAAVTTNIVFQEFDPEKSTDAAFISRISSIQATYPNAEERVKMALSQLGQIKEQIRLKFGDDSLELLNEEICQNGLRKIAEEDAKRVLKFGGAVGFRGFMSLLSKYRQYVSAKIASCDEMNAEICSFTGPPRDFNLLAEAESIQDYKKATEPGMAEAEEKHVFSSRIRDIEELISEPKLTISDKEDVQFHFEFVKNSTLALTERRKHAQAIEKRVRFRLNSLPLSQAKEIGKRLEETFGHLKTEGAQVEDTADCDSFVPLMNALSNIWVRWNTLIDESLAPLKNKLIRADFTSSDAKDDYLCEKISKIFSFEYTDKAEIATSPVCYIQHPEHLFLKKKSSIAISPRLLDPSNELSQLLHPLTEYQINPYTEKKIEHFRFEGNQFFYVKISESYYFIKEESLPSLLGLYQKKPISGGMVNIFSGDTLQTAFVKLEMYGGLTEEALRVRLPQTENWIPNIVDYCLKQTEGKKYQDKMFIAISLTEAIEAEIMKYNAMHFATRQPSGVNAFENAVSKIMNVSSLSVHNGEYFIDPRAMSVFLLSTKPFRGTRLSGEYFVDFMLSPPPNQSRQKSAENIVLKFLQKDSSKEEESIGLSELLCSKEQGIFQALIAFDQNVILKAKEVGLNVLLDPLAFSAQKFAENIESRKSNLFGIALEIPSIKAFESQWREYYYDILRSIEKVEQEYQQREIQKERFRLIEVQRAEEERILRLKAEAEALAASAAVVKTTE